jgi:hypothetical protein
MITRGDDMPGPALNTARELFREDTGDPAGSYYENSVHVTEAGSIGMNVGGYVIVQPISATAAAAGPGGVGRAALVGGDGDRPARRQGDDLVADEELRRHRVDVPELAEHPGDAFGADHLPEVFEADGAGVDVSWRQPIRHRCRLSLAPH